MLSDRLAVPGREAERLGPVLMHLLTLGAF